MTDLYLYFPLLRKVSFDDHVVKVLGSTWDCAGMHSPWCCCCVLPIITCVLFAVQSCINNTYQPSLLFYEMLPRRSPMPPYRGHFGCEKVEEPGQMEAEVEVKVSTCAVYSSVHSAAIYEQAQREIPFQAPPTSKKWPSGSGAAANSRTDKLSTHTSFSAGRKNRGVSNVSRSAPGSGAAAGRSGRQARASKNRDWLCLVCENVNYPSRDVCNRCQRPRAGKD